MRANQLIIIIAPLISTGIRSIVVRSVRSGARAGVGEPATEIPLHNRGLIAFLLVGLMLLVPVAVIVPALFDIASPATPSSRSAGASCSA